MAAAVVNLPMVMREGNFQLGTAQAPLIAFSASPAATSNCGPIVNPSAAGIKVVINLTTMTTATLTVTIEGVDPVSGAHYTLLASAGLVATGTTVLTVSPGAVVTANVSANDHLPAYFNIKAVVVGGAAAVTGTIGASLLF